MSPRMSHCDFAVDTNNKLFVNCEDVIEYVKQLEEEIKEGITDKSVSEQMEIFFTSVEEDMNCEEDEED